jgi:LacI family transcriptional regulator
MPATIKDVARLAHCSTKTVSRVINAEPNVTEETRARVQTAIRDAGYAPNISARRLVQQKSYMICLLMPPDYYPTASNVLARLLDAGFENNYDILLQIYFAARPRSRTRLVNLIYEHRIDGIVTTPPLDTDAFFSDLLNTYKVPQVQINPFNRSSAIPYVAGEDYQGAYAMAEHLLQLGHRRIGFLKGPRNLRASFDRLYGFQSALDTHGIPFTPESAVESGFSFAGGYSAARVVLGQTPRPTALFAGNDQAAFGAIFAAQEMGLRIPHDLSVCGCDDLDFSGQVWPGLTTVHQPGEEIVEAAAHLLVDILEGRPPVKAQVILPSHLVIRASTAPPSLA